MAVLRGPNNFSCLSDFILPGTSGRPLWRHYEEDSCSDFPKHRTLDSAGLGRSTHWNNVSCSLWPGAPHIHTRKWITHSNTIIALFSSQSYAHYCFNPSSPPGFQWKGSERRFLYLTMIGLIFIATFNCQTVRKKGRFPSNQYLSHFPQTHADVYMHTV